MIYLTIYSNLYTETNLCTHSNLDNNNKCIPTIYDMKYVCNLRLNLRLPKTQTKLEKKEGNKNNNKCQTFHLEREEKQRTSSS